MPLIFIRNARRDRAVHPVLPRTHRDNTRRVDGLMAAEIVGADMVEIDRFSNARHLINIAQETVQVQVIADAVFITLEVGNIHWIKANQRCPQTNVCFRQAVARQVAMLAEDLLKTLQRFKYFSHCVVIRFWLVAKPAL